MKDHLVRDLAPCMLLIICAAATPSTSAQTDLPPFRTLPSEATLRLAQAVEERVHLYGAPFGDAVLDEVDVARVAPSDLVQSERRRDLWQAIEGAMAPSSASAPAAAPLIDLLDGAIGAYMAELGRIAHEIDRSGGDAVELLAPLHPGEHGSGTIEVGTLGAFRSLLVSFRGEIAHPDGRTPAVVAHFYLLPDRAAKPVPGRLLIPVSGAEPSFRATVRNANGAPESRDYGWRPIIRRSRSILELRIDGRWARVEDELDSPRRRRVARDPLSFCDAGCAGR